MSCSSAESFRRSHIPTHEIPIIYSVCFPRKIKKCTFLHFFPIDLSSLPFPRGIPPNARAPHTRAPRPRRARTRSRSIECFSYHQTRALARGAMFQHAPTGAFARAGPPPRQTPLASGAFDARARARDASPSRRNDAMEGFRVRRPTPMYAPGRGALTRVNVILDRARWMCARGCWRPRRELSRELTRATRAGPEDAYGTMSGARVDIGSDSRESGDAREPERAFHSVHDLVHYAILSQPSGAASLRMIYSVCQREGRIASKHGGASRLITANEHWKSQIRHALYTSPRFRRLDNDDWGVSPGHQSMPDTTTVLVSKDERRTSVLGAPTAHFAKTSTMLPKKRAALPDLSLPKEMPSWEADDYRSSPEPETTPLPTLDGEKVVKLMRTSSSQRSGSGVSARSTETRIGRTQRQSGASPKTRTPSRSPTRSESPEPRESSTLVIIAGALERNGKVTPRDPRRNRRKPLGGGHHAAMPADTECHVDLPSPGGVLSW